MTEISKFEPCPQCGRFDNRGISVDLIIARGNQILLGKRAHEPYQGYWAIFGGFIEWDEKPEQTLERELFEETGLKLISSKLVGVYGDPKRHPRQVITIAYSVGTEGEPKTTDEITEIKWVDLDKVPDNLACDHNQIIRDFIAQKERG